ncbi:MAG: DUF3892 domain-containing protein [Bacteroidetes bacterium]|nr:DUF3892 domain-containing protein [Bacteroidota bacterium]MCH8034386.1 DUF3892 domain-containing protein [Bacteroidota bacterium]
MEERRVSGSDNEGDIRTLCNGGEFCSSRQKNDAISDIDLNLHTYYLPADNKKAYVIVKSDTTGKYLTTSEDGTTANNFVNLSDC